MIQNSNIKKLIVTDTVYIPESKHVEKLEIISTAELFANAILNLNRGDSISDLYLRY